MNSELGSLLLFLHRAMQVVSESPGEAAMASAARMRPTPTRTGTSRGREPSHGRDRTGDPWKGSPGSQEPACCSCRREILSYLPPEQRVP